MTKEEEIILEEILLGYLRSSKQILLQSINKEDCKDIGKNKYTVVFEVDKNFASTLVNSLDNQFSQFFNNKDK